MYTPLVFDATNLVRRSIAATIKADLKADRTFTGGLYQSWLTTAKLLRTLQPKHGNSHYSNPGPVWMVYDAGVPDERAKLLPEYKQHRRKKQLELTDEEKQQAYEQIELSKRLFELLGCRVCAFNGYEADDGVAGITAQLIKRGLRPLVVSGDHDLFQLVSIGARCYDLNAKRFVIRSNFRELMGVDADRFVAYRTLTGDSSDNIEGLRGCGPATARAFMSLLPKAGATQRETLELLIKHCKNMPVEDRGTMTISLLEHAATLRNVLKAIDLTSPHWHPIGTRDPFALQCVPVDRNEVLRFALRFEFRTMALSPMEYVTPFVKASQAAEKGKPVATTRRAVRL